MRSNPIDVFSRLATAEGYEHERVDLNELHLSVTGLWCDLDISITWNLGKEQVQIFLIFEGRTPGGRSNDICRLMSLINERLAAGHFDYWDKNEALVYRNSVSLRAARP